MRDYELVYIVPSNRNDEEVGALTDRIQGWIAAEGGEVQRINPWGRRRLAYPIQDFRDALYIQLNFRGSPATLRALDRNLKLAEDVIRFLVTRPGA